MVSKRISLTRTVLYSNNDDTLCSCTGKFWKTCALRVISNLPCVEAIVTITPIERTEKDPASNIVKSLDASLAKLTDGLRCLEDKFKI